MLEIVRNVSLIVNFIQLLIIVFFVIKKNRIEKSVEDISYTLKHIFMYDTNEKVMMFSENRYIIDLMKNINCILDKHQKEKANYKRMEFLSKRMLSNISHDLKTPLTVILGYLEVLILSDFSEKDIVIKINKKTLEVIELINKFFTLSKIESGDIYLDIEKINLSELCKRVIVDFYEILTKKNFVVDIEIPEKDIIVKGNNDAIIRILDNLISNVIKYADDGKYISIKLYDDCKDAFVEVKDKGKGIDKENIINVFERLYTVDDSRNINFSGNGLGLAIAKNLAKKQNGSLELRSIPYVETVFTLKLPLFILNFNERFS